MSKQWEILDLSDLEGIRVPAVEWTSPFLIFTGETGAGKTMTAKGFLKRWQGHEWINAVDFIDTIRACRRDEEALERHLKLARELPRLVIDDLGFEEDNPIGSWGTKYSPKDIYVNILVARHYKRLRTLITTNLNSESLKKRYGDKVYSRIKEVSTFYHFTGDYRQRALKHEVTREDYTPPFNECDIPLDYEPADQSELPDKPIDKEEMRELYRQYPFLRRFIKKAMGIEKGDGNDGEVKGKGRDGKVRGGVSQGGGGKKGGTAKGK